MHCIDGAPCSHQMRPQLRRPPPGATDVLAALAPWFPKGFAPSRAVRLHPHISGCLVPKHAVAPGRHTQAHLLLHVRLATCAKPVQTAESSPICTAGNVWLPHQAGTSDICRRGCAEEI